MPVGLLLAAGLGKRFDPSSHSLKLPRRQRGDRGARELLVAQPPHLIEVDDAGVLADVDQSGGTT